MEENQVQIPEGWHLKQVQEFALKMRSGGTPKSDNPRYYNGDIPFVAIDDLTSANKYLEKTQKQITKEGLNNSAAWVVPVNTIMYSIYATLGVPRINLIEAATNQAILNIIPDESKITLEFLYYLLLEKRSSILAHSAHTTQSNLNAKIVKELEFVFPQKTTEQTQIASILSKVDESIAQTEQLIAKYTRIKTGLMQDLLTKGIDELGNIRSEATHEFKDSPLGRIPKEWEVENLGNIINAGNGFIQTGPFGSQLHANEYVVEGIPVIMPQDIKPYGLDYSNIAKITWTKANSLKRHVVQENDIVFARRGDLRKCTFINSQFKGAVCGTGCLLIRLNKAELNPCWLELIYKHHTSQKEIDISAVGSTMKNLNTSILYNLPIPEISVLEQNRVVDYLNKIQNTVDEYTAQNFKLQSLKTGLMHDLLSGRVRVKFGCEN